MDSELSSLEIDRDGVRPTITKSAEGKHCSRLIHEAAMLRAARHPGVVSLVNDDATSDDGCQLRMYFVGSRTLASLGRVEPERAAALIAAVSLTVADLHEAGIAHSRLSADHVIVAADGRPIICGFGDAYFIPSLADGANDVAALGQLLHDLVTTTDASLELPERHQRKRLSRATLRAPLLNLAEAAMETDPRRRPTARQFSELIQSTVPGASLSGRRNAAAPKESSGGLNDGLPAGALVAIALGVCCLIAAGSMVLFRQNPPSEPIASPEAQGPAPVLPGPPSTPTTPTVPERPTAHTPSTVPPSAETTTTMVAEGLTPPATLFVEAKGCSLTAGSAAVTSDGETCSALVSLANTTLRIDDALFDFGQNNLVVAIGDYSCTSGVKPAVGDLDTGFVYLFDSWASENANVSGVAVGHVDGLRQLLAEPTANGCNQLVALDEWGIRHLITLPNGGA